MINRLEDIVRNIAQLSPDTTEIIIKTSRENIERISKAFLEEYTSKYTLFEIEGVPVEKTTFTEYTLALGTINPPKLKFEVCN